MSTFPNLESTQYPFTLTPIFNTLVSNFNQSNERRRKKQLFPKYDLTINYTFLTIEDCRALYEFYMENSGSFGSFYIYDYAEKLYHTFIHKDQYVATTDGTTLIYDIPGKSTSGHTVYLAGLESTINYTILIGGGESDSDRIEFTTAPPVGLILTIDFAGYLRMKVRFKDDELSRINTQSELYTYTIQLKGLSS